MKQEKEQEANVVRKAQRNDAEFVRNCQIAMARETEGLELNVEVLSRGIAAVLSDPSKGEYWIVERGGEAVCMCLTIPEWSDWRNGTVLWIHSVYTVPSARGQGVYGRLYGHLKKMVETSDQYRGLRLYVDRRNMRAKRVYEGHGMSNEHYELYEWLK